MVVGASRGRRGERARRYRGFCEPGRKGRVDLLFTISPAILYLVTTKSSAMVFSTASLSSAMSITSREVCGSHVTR